MNWLKGIFCNHKRLDMVGREPNPDGGTINIYRCTNCYKRITNTAKG